ncbi:hypothetical protein LCGC14_1776580, partial [marine sediment metagenome]
MGPYLGDYKEDETLYFNWDTNDGEGASITRATNGTIRVYKDNNVTQSTAGITDVEDFDSLTGVHNCRIVLTDAFYVTGSDYSVVLVGAVIDGQTVNAVLATFSIENRLNSVVENNLDHLMKVPVADRDVMAEIVDGTALANIMTKTDGDTSDFDPDTDSLEAIRDNIVAASPQRHFAESDNIVTGTRDGGTTYTNTLTINSTYFQTSPVTPAVGGFGLNVELVFTVGTGLNRVPSSVNMTGYFDAIPVRFVHVWAYNYLASSWDQLSDNGSAILDGSSNEDYQYALSSHHLQTSDGEVKIRFTSASTTAADDLYIDYVGVGSLAVEAAGLTAEAIAQAVHSHDVS